MFLSICCVHFALWVAVSVDTDHAVIAVAAISIDIAFAIVDGICMG